MATIITDLKEAFRRGNIYIQLIYINVAVFCSHYADRGNSAIIQSQPRRCV